MSYFHQDDHRCSTGSASRRTSRLAFDRTAGAAGFQLTSGLDLLGDQRSPSSPYDEHRRHQALLEEQMQQQTYSERLKAEIDSARRLIEARYQMREQLLRQLLPQQQSEELDQQRFLPKIPISENLSLFMRLKPGQLINELQERLNTCNKPSMTHPYCPVNDNYEGGLFSILNNSAPRNVAPPERNPIDSNSDPSSSRKGTAAALLSSLVAQGTPDGNDTVAHTASPGSLLELAPFLTGARCETASGSYMNGARAENSSGSLEDVMASLHVASPHNVYKSIDEARNSAGTNTTFLLAEALKLFHGTTSQHVASSSGNAGEPLTNVHVHKQSAPDCQEFLNKQKEHLESEKATTAALLEATRRSTRHISGLKRPMEGFPSHTISPAVKESDQTQNQVLNSTTTTLPAHKRQKRRYDHEAFPQKLHRLITDAERAGKGHIISFLEEGGFRVDDQNAFVKELMCHYFRGNSWSSFRRQLFSYRFPIIKSGPQKGAFRNPLFLKCRSELCQFIERDDKYDRGK